VAVVLCVSLLVGPVSAAPAPMPRVVLVRPPAAPPSVSEALVRLRGELLAAGFEAEVLELPLGADVRESLERLTPSANDNAATALVAVVASAEPGSAELWVIDRVTGKTVVRRVNAGTPDTTRAAEVLAVRAVELLRASFLELAIARPSNEAAAPVPAAPAVERWATATLEERDWTWAIEAGGATAVSVQGGWNQFMAVARLERAFGGRFCARLAFTGLGTPAHVSTADTGSVDLSETMLLAEAVVRFRRDRRLQPQLSAGAGVMRLNVDGEQMDPNMALTSTHWNAAGDVGAGLRMPLSRHRFEIGLEAHALWAQPYPRVQYFGQEIALVGRPTVLVTLTLLGGV
jgi:hypothetical protein